MENAYSEPQALRRHRIPRWAITTLIVIIAIPGVYRVITRGLPAAIDLSPDCRATFLSARAWVQGHNPYIREEQMAQWSAVRPSGEEDLPTSYWTTEVSLYPPGLCALVAPLTLLPWKTVRIVLLVFHLGLSLLAWLALCRALRLPLSGWRAQLLGALWLSVGPFITCLHLANPALPAAMLCVLAVCLAADRADIAGGILLGLAIVIKPQIGGALLLCYLLRKRPRVWVTALALFCLLEGIGMGRLWLAHVQWLPALKANFAVVTGPGGFNDAGLENAVRWQLINLQVPLFVIISQRLLVNVLAWAIVAGIGVFYLRGLRRPFEQVNELLVVSIPLVLCLLPVYHRYYDSLILVIPLAWSIASLGTPRRVHAILILACTIPFYVSGAFVLSHLQETHRIPAVLQNSLLWNFIILPHQSWCLIILCFVMMHAIWGTGRDRAESSVTPELAAC